MSVPDRSILSELPQLLSWRDGSTVLRTSCSIYINCVYQRLRLWASTAKPELWDIVRGLNRESQRRLLLAPQTFYLLQSTDRPNSEQLLILEKLIDAEKYLAGEGDLSVQDSWTALGDYYFAKTDGASQPVKLPAVGHLVLDIYSPFSTIHYPSPYGKIEKHKSEDMEVIVPRIAKSLEQIRSISPLTAQLVEASVQVLALANTPDNPALTCSASLRALIGRMSLINLQNDGWTIPGISNSIVHEAIHSMLYKLELAHDFYTDDEAAHRITTTSPWSGRSLLLHSFVHACFVWFGLWCFWNKTHSDEDGIAALRGRAASGFLAGPAFEHLTSEAYEGIKPDLRGIIQEMFEYVRNQASRAPDSRTSLAENHPGAAAGSSVASAMDNH